MPIETTDLMEPYANRDTLRANLLLRQYLLEIDLQHVGLFNEELAFAIQEQPGEIMPLVRNKATFICSMRA